MLLYLFDAIKHKKQIIIEYVFIIIETIKMYTKY